MSSADFFKAIGLPRKADLDPEEIQKSFQRLSKKLHPDSGSEPSEERFIELNTARQNLTGISSRLKHLLELNDPSFADDHSFPEDMMDLFSELNQVFTESQKVIEAKEKAASDLGKALLADSVFQVREKLESNGNRIAQRLTLISTQRLGEIDASLEKNAPGAIRDLALTYREAAFLEKWQTQVREKLLALM